MYKAQNLPPAKQDIKNSAIWYNEKQHGLGKKFTAEVRKKVKFIQQNPKAIAIRYDDTRTAVVDVFPFMIHFPIEKNKNRIDISAVYHTSQNPNIWGKR